MDTTLARAALETSVLFEPTAVASLEAARDPLRDLLEVLGPMGDVSRQARVTPGPVQPSRPENLLLKTWIPLTVAEFALLGVTASLPKDWTGWSPNFVQDGIRNFGEAYSKPPVWDTDNWFHNYLGHPYGGSVYYNAVRSRGATIPESILFTTILSTQWEYVFEAVAERPSIQDLVITPVAGSLLGELTHRTAVHLKRGGTTFLERAALLVLNPMHALFAGLGPRPAEIQAE